jgi:hypothetical protein
MHRNFLIAAALAATAAGCASVPSGPTGAQAAASSCDAIRAEIARVAADKRAALAKEQGAWKAVVPVAVAAVYASGKAAESDADRKVAELEKQAAAQGCAQS